MLKISALLKNEYENEYDLSLQKKYTTPKIYNANNDLKKRWYVYYSYRNPITNKLERQTPIYLGVNQFEKLQDRTAAIKILRNAVENLLIGGHNPFNTDDTETEVKKYNIEDAFTFVLNLKQKTLSENSYKDLRIRLTAFKKYLLENGYQNRYIASVTKKSVLNYLNSVLEQTSARNRNNARSNISIFFATLCHNDIIPVNFVEKINVLKSEPTRNKTYTTNEHTNIFEYLEKTDPQLLLYIKFISYNYLRPIEVVRLQIKNIDQIEKRLFIKTKTKNYKIKIIPEILLKELGDLSIYDPESFLFTPDGMGKDWQTNETDKRGYFGKRFAKVKNHFNLGADYGLYSFRHTFITMLYRELVKDSTPFEAKSKLMLITGHTTMTALEKYLRDIDAELPEDYSKFINKKTL